MLNTIVQKLANGQCYTMSTLQNELSISNKQLIEAIETLQDYGISFHPVSKEIVQLQHPLDLLNTELITAALPDTIRKKCGQIDIFSTLESTNQYLLYYKGSPKIHVCSTEYQQNGRGRRGKQWLSPYASGLCFSLKYHYTSSHNLAGLSLAIGIAVTQWLHELGCTEAVIKWPNDIWWKNQKLAGLLIETTGMTKNSCDVIIGIGINVSLPEMNTPPSDYQWVDLHTVLGAPSPSRNQLIAQLMTHCIHALEQFEQSGLIPFLPLWSQFDYLYGKQINLLTSEETITGIAQGIDEQGALRLQQGNKITTYVCGEVSVRL